MRNHGTKRKKGIGALALCFGFLAAGSLATAQTVTAQTVTAQTVTAQTVTAQTVTAQTVTAQTATELTGTEIMVRVNGRPQARDMSAVLTMTLINAQGSTRTRILQQYQADFGAVDKKMMFFLEPADVRGSAFMTWSYGQADRSDEQWIFLPALKKIKRISSEGRGDSFMGSDFSYEDLATRPTSLDSHGFLRSETIEGSECLVVESVPRDRKSSLYAKTLSWIRKDSWIGLKREYYDAKGALLKTLLIRRIGDVGGYRMILETEMKNARTGHSTRMSFGDMKLDAGIKESIFSERSLEKGVK